LQCDDQPVGGRKVAHGQIEQFPRGTGRQFAFAAVRLQPVERVFAQFVKPDFVPHALAFPQVIQRHADRDARNPVLERRAAVELFQRPPRLDKRFLRQIFEPLRVAFVTVQHREYARLMLADDLGEFVRRPAPDPFQQLSFIAHRVRYMAEPCPQVEIKFTTGLFAQFGINAVDRLVNETVQL
jgi:hypothetical protein